MRKLLMLAAAAAVFLLTPVLTFAAEPEIDGRFGPGRHFLQKTYFSETSKKPSKGFAKHTRQHKALARRGQQTERSTQIAAHEPKIVEHPAGCPGTLFCGCGVSVRAYGHSVRDLWLASNWGEFPPAAMVSGMVAWRHGHVVYIEQPLGNNMALVYDPNSGGHKTRIWVRSLAGYNIVDPHGVRSAARVSKHRYAHHRRHQHIRYAQSR